MIPEAKITAVANALQVTFGVSDFEAISQLTAGLSSALIFRIVVKGQPYLLRIITRADAPGDPSHYYGCMKAAADAGIAPHVWYAGVADRISITDFIEAKPFPQEQAKVLMPDVLRRLHALPRFPFRLNYFDFANSSVRKFQASKILPESVTNNVFQQYEQIIKVYPHKEEDLVSCHNDLKPDNLLFDGKQVWLVDWEGAFLNDRYTELAVVSNFILKNEDDEKEYLKIYFGKEVTACQQARFFLACQLMHIIYFSFFMSLGTAGDNLVNVDLTIPGFSELHNRLWKGEVNLLNHHSQQQYAFVHLERVKQHLQLKRFEEAVNIVAELHSESQ
ncbi:MAG: Choline/ethanolamine kinase [Ferruginibacter sp.]|uniref:phosphotransferase n=1 Tax=Ferruginibacter sp. TaxID=1940288 RepID=UPI002658F6C8|nr:phosphotransferase [Ferruginibacter sp.]MDB5279844.1 Choline/ethanolamine kinase [Ferruginibacter sp.]